MPSATLENRGFIGIDGDDAEDFLQGLITTDVAGLTKEEWWPGALLTPQGKMMFDFLIARSGTGFLLECAGEQRDPLLKRLTMYRLRAKVALSALPESCTAISWGEAAPPGAMRDHRFVVAGLNLWRHPGTGGSDDIALYHTVAVENGVAGGGENGSPAEYFPHDLLMDRNGGLSFRKGCYVGQEVVSRMQHRSTARRRLVIASAEAPFAPGDTGVTVDGREIGTLVGASGLSGLAVVRIDKAGAAIAEGHRIVMAGQPVSLRLPSWSGLEFPTGPEDAES